MSTSISLSRPWVGLSYHSIHRQQLVSSLQPSLAVSNALRDYSRDVDRGVLLFAPHDVKAKTLISLG